ncbi:MAG: hypothetical protein HeimC2_08410 [Candidatus Heimdallarchaeota archaeon LC_2]|nr:MAG: hypothetical protein HeimC2_08410 [Candidatus Heimdallarchaeota archaeon LC_2]
MNFAYTTYSFLIGLGFVGASIFNFIENDNETGRSFLLMALIAFLASYYLLKTLYYLRHQATFNEVSFVIFLPISIILQVMAKHALEVEFNELFSLHIEGIGDRIELSVDFFDLGLLPYFVFSTFLLLRSYLRYPFIRLHGHSERGFPAKFTGLLLSIIIPILFLVVGLVILENAFLVIFAIFFATIGLIGFFV